MSLYSSLALVHSFVRTQLKYSKRKAATSSFFAPLVIRSRVLFSSPDKEQLRPSTLTFIFPKSAFEEQLYVDFEGYKLPIPVGYDDYLKMAFGDYMQLPPVEKRVCHHEFEKMDMDNCYKIYKGRYYCVKENEK